MTAASGDAAVANGRQYDTYDSGMCQKYVRGPCWEVGSLYGSAIDAWNGARHKHPGDRTPPMGAPVYYRGGSYGHAVICVGDGRIRSTDCTSRAQVNDAALSWPETAWGYEYLGWTEDINGVMLPIGDNEDMPLNENDLEKIAHRVNMVLGDYTSDGDKRGDVKDPEQGNARLNQIETVVRRLEDKVERLLDKS